MADLQTEIQQVLDRLIACWGDMRLPDIKGLWDAHEEKPYYVPEEVEEALTSWPDIEKYWQHTMATISRLSMRIWAVEVKPLGPDLAVAVYKMHWNADVAGFPKPLGGDNRVTAIFRNTSDGWRFCHYVEAPLAAITYMRQLYELNVDESFKNN